MQKQENPTQESKPQRSLIIGVGGTGAEVLAGNKRRVIRKYGSMENVPMIRYLYIDTDPTWWQAQQSRVEKSVRLSHQEVVDIQIQGVDELYQGIKQGGYPHYAWFDLQKLGNLKSVGSGAGTVRQMARLAFWYNYSKIRESIEKQLKELRNDSVATFMRAKHGLQLDDGVSVHIVAGLAGGTGSGLWLDTAYLVRKILTDMGIAGDNQIVGYGVLPQAFRNLAGTNAMANGYACLKELNYYSYIYSPNNPLAQVFGEPVWDADYLGDAVNRVMFKGEPPFEYCYLVDSRNANVDLDRKDIYHMIDCSIFQEFAGSFASYKRSRRVNVRNQLLQNDRADYPIRFMSFGQASALVPMEAVKQILAHQLALQAVQQWIDKKAEPIRLLAADRGTPDQDPVESVVGSIREKAKGAALRDKVRGWLVRDFMPANGLSQGGVLKAMVQEHQERLTDLPYSLAEAVKQEWVTENWSYNTFTGRVTNAWEKWRTDFNDEGADRMRWGERIRKLEANKAVALKTYSKLFREEAYRLFEDSEHFGPAWAVCSLNLLKSGLGQLKEVSVNEANNANAIANALGDTFVIDAVANNRGPTLSAIIEAEATKDLERLSNLLRGWSLGKHKAVSDAAYQYLRRCALWCRARVEERARREAGELMEQLIRLLGELEEELIGHASLLAGLEGEIVKQTLAWNQKATQDENIGTLLYDAPMLERLEAKLRERRGDLYSASVVARKALESIGGNLRGLHQDEMQALLSKLVQAGLEAVGDLNEAGLEDTEFAAHDLLSAAYRSDDALDGVLREVMRKSAPYVRLTPAVADGGWTQGKYLIPIQGAGLRGGGSKENDPDADHARVIESMARNQWNVRDGVRPVEDPTQIMLFQECGGFPLRAIQGMAEMKKAYEQQQSEPNTPPLHISKDEIAECYPDIFPPRPELLGRACVLQTVAIPLGFIGLRDFPSLTRDGKPNRQFAFLRYIPELGETQAVPLGATVETIGIKLANQQELLGEIEEAISLDMAKASEADKAQYAAQLREYLSDKKAALQEGCPGFDAANSPAYQVERDRVVAFMRDHGLANSNSETDSDTQRVSARGVALVS